MIKLVILLLTLIIGFVGGGTLVWFLSYQPDAVSKKPVIGFDQILRYSNQAIDEGNMYCEGDNVKTVGSVVGSIFEANSQNIRNMVSYKCTDLMCLLSVTNCKPWQSSECGSRILRFDIMAQEIDKNSFACLDVP